MIFKFIKKALIFCVFVSGVNAHANNDKYCSLDIKKWDALTLEDDFRGHPFGEHVRTLMNRGKTAPQAIEEALKVNNQSIANKLGIPVSEVSPLPKSEQFWTDLRFDYPDVYDYLHTKAMAAPCPLDPDADKEASSLNTETLKMSNQIKNELESSEATSDCKQKGQQYAQTIQGVNEASSQLLKPKPGELATEEEEERFQRFAVAQEGLHEEIAGLVQSTCIGPGSKQSLLEMSIRTLSTLDNFIIAFASPSASAVGIALASQLGLKILDWIVQERTTVSKLADLNSNEEVRKQFTKTACLYRDLTNRVDKLSRLTSGSTQEAYENEAERLKFDIAQTKNIIAQCVPETAAPSYTDFLNDYEEIMNFVELSDKKKCEEVQEFLNVNQYKFLDVLNSTCRIDKNLSYKMKLFCSKLIESMNNYTSGVVYEKPADDQEGFFVSANNDISFCHNIEANDRARKLQSLPSFDQSFNQALEQTYPTPSPGELVGDQIAYVNAAKTKLSNLEFQLRGLKLGKDSFSRALATDSTYDLLKASGDALFKGTLMDKFEEIYEEKRWFDKLVFKQTIKDKIKEVGDTTNCKDESDRIKRRKNMAFLSETLGDLKESFIIRYKMCDTINRPVPPVINPDLRLSLRFETSYNKKGLCNEEKLKAMKDGFCQNIEAFESYVKNTPQSCRGTSFSAVQ